MSARLFGIVILIFICHGLSLGQMADASSELQVGISFLNEGQYEKAVEHLERAVDTAPQSIEAHMYLARACTRLYVPSPNTDSDDYMRPLTCAIQEYNIALRLDSGNTEALNSLGYIYTRIFRDWNKAATYYRRAIGDDSRNFEALYTLGSVLWVQVYRERHQTCESLKMKKNEKLISRSSCLDLRTTNRGKVDEAISLLNRALQLVDNPDAMRYISSLYRERAELQCQDKAAYESDMAAADDWALRSCGAKDTALPERCPPGPRPSSVRGCSRRSRQ